MIYVVLDYLHPDDLLDQLTPFERGVALRAWAWLIGQIEAEASANLGEDHFHPEIAGPLQDLVRVLRSHIPHPHTVGGNSPCPTP